MKSAATRLSTEIQGRFFQAFRESVRIGRIKSLKNFCDRHGLNRTKYALLLIRTDCPERVEETGYKFIDMAALAAICEDAKVSERWLLLGKGDMFRRKKTRHHYNDDKQGEMECQVPATQAEQG